MVNQKNIYGMTFHPKYMMYKWELQFQAHLNVLVFAINTEITCSAETIFIRKMYILHYISYTWTEALSFKHIQKHIVNLELLNKLSF